MSRHARQPARDTLANRGQTAPVLFAPTLIPQGDGSFLLKPGEPLFRRRKLTVVEAGLRAGLSGDTILRLYDAGLVEGERPSLRKLFIYEDSLDAHLAATANREFWTDQTRRRPYLAVAAKVARLRRHRR